MISINTNLNNLLMQSNLSTAQNAVNVALQRMSTGYRINSAKDDAAGMFVASKLASQLNGIFQAQKNTKDGISLLQTAEGSLNTVNGILNRLRDLSVQSSNGIYDTESRAAMQNEADELMKELDRISKSTTFNGLNLFKGSGIQTAQAFSVSGGGG